MSTNNPRKLYRDTENQKIFGVCSGLADYLQADVALNSGFYRNPSA